MIIFKIPSCTYCSFCRVEKEDNDGNPLKVICEAMEDYDYAEILWNDEIAAGAPPPDNCPLRTQKVQYEFTTEKFERIEN